jgi:hypothetical protein
MDGEQNTEAVATTTFTSDANMAMTEVAHPLAIPRALVDSSTTGYSQPALSQFLEKPFLLKSGTITTMDSVGTSLFTANLPQDAFFASPTYANKLDGFLGWRGTMHVKLQINGQRFQQGRYFLNFVHTAGTDPTTVNAALAVSAHNNTLTARTQTMRAEIDINCDTETCMSIPFVNVNNFMLVSSLITPTYETCVGQLNFWPYSPMIAPTGSTVAGYSIWVHFTDNEFIGPAAPQGRGGVVVSKGKKSLSEKEAGSVGVGPISSTLIMVRDAASILSDIPFISAYASPASWVADRLAGAASVFGWSSPVDMGPSMRVVRDMLPFFGNVDGVSEVEPLTLSVKNTVGVFPGFSGTDTDEMDFGFLKTIPAYDQTITWATTATSGTNLVDYKVGATASVRTRTAAGGTVITDFKPFEFIASQFTNCRGSLTYTFKFVKTEFHSGRLVFAFFPANIDSVAPTHTLANSVYVHREIIDVRLQNEVTFTVPYLSASPWKSINDPYGYTGYFSVFVLDPLVAPANVSTTVQILVEMSAGPDWEVSVPAPSTVYPIYGITPQSGSGTVKGAGPALETQENACSLTEAVVGGGKIMPGFLVNEEACVGESITSFRALLKQTRILANESSTNPINLYAGVNYINWTPFAMPVRFLGTYAGSPYYYSGGQTPDLFALLGSIYAFSRGGVRLKCIVSSRLQAQTQYEPRTFLCALAEGQTPQTNRTVAINELYDQFGANTMLYSHSVPTIYHNTKANNSFEFRVGQYGRFHSRSNIECLTAGGGSGVPVYGGYVAYNGTYPQIYASTEFYNTGAATSGPSDYICARSGAEDTNFGLFISIPPMSGLVTIVEP